MKRQFINLLAITLFATVIIFSCKKKETTTPDEPEVTTTAGSTTGSTTTGGATPSTLALNTWMTSRGTNSVYVNVQTSASTSAGGGNNTRKYGFIALTNGGTPQAKTAQLYLSFADSVNLPATGSYTLVGLQNSTQLLANQVFITHAGSSLSGTFFSSQNGGIINVTNNGGVMSFVGNNLVGSNSAPTSSLSLNLKY